MNYYPNYYMNYPYTCAQPNIISPQMQQTTNAPAPGPMNQNTILPQNQLMGLNGKIVDGEDVVKATEVPIGGYGIFPKADLSEIYLKTWNNNGTTSIITFKPIINPQPAEGPHQNVITLDDIMNRIDALENKITNFAMGNSAETQTKEVAKDAFKL